MKFHSTTNVTPIKGYGNSAYYKQNKFIPSFDSQILQRSRTEGTDSDDEENEDDCFGRKVQFETITVTTPVMTNTRHHQVKTNQPALVSQQPYTKRPVMSKKDVHELNDMLQSLSLKGDNRNKSNKNRSKKDNQTHRYKCKNDSTELSRYRTIGGIDAKNTMIQSTTTTPKKTSASSSSYFGRCTVMIYNTITNEFVQVIRSARFFSSSSSSSSSTTTTPNSTTSTK